MNKYIIAKVLPANADAALPYYVAIDHSTGKVVAQADDLPKLHEYMGSIGWTWEQQ